MRSTRIRGWTSSTRWWRGRAWSCSTAGSSQSRRATSSLRPTASLTESAIRAHVGCWCWRFWHRPRDQNAVFCVLGGFSTTRGKGGRAGKGEGPFRPSPLFLFRCGSRPFDKDFLDAPVVHVGDPHRVLVRAGEAVRPVELPHLVSRDAEHAQDLSVERHLVEAARL